jgi:branched-subunit amino acid ABC-type transport system permease component
VLIYKATETVSFAQGDLMMLGAFCGLALMTCWAAVLARRASAVPRWGCSAAARAAVIRPILGQPQFSIVMLTIGIGYIVRGLITMIPNIGTETHTLPVPYKDRSGTWAGWCCRRAAGGHRRHRAAVRAAVRDVPLQQDRHRDAGQLAEPAGGLLHGHSGASG